MMRTITGHSKKHFTCTMKIRSSRDRWRPSRSTITKFCRKSSKETNSLKFKRIPSKLRTMKSIENSRRLASRELKNSSSSLKNFRSRVVLRKEILCSSCSRVAWGMKQREERMSQLCKKWRERKKRKKKMKTTKTLRMRAIHRKIKTYQEEKMNSRKKTREKKKDPKKRMKEKSKKKRKIIKKKKELKKWRSQQRRAPRKNNKKKLSQRRMPLKLMRLISQYQIRLMRKKSRKQSLMLMHLMLPMNLMKHSRSLLLREVLWNYRRMNLLLLVMPLMSSIVSHRWKAMLLMSLIQRQRWKEMLLIIDSIDYEELLYHRLAFLKPLRQSPRTVILLQNLFLWPHPAKIPWVMLTQNSITTQSKMRERVT